MKQLAFLVCLLFPGTSFAAVQITEIAWMGGAESANHEWIELYNPGSDISVDGWILHDANNLTIELEGTISAGQRVVLERTSDASAPGSAFLLYTGALSNTGTTLVLRDAAGDVVDQVVGGENWEQVGGDNTTKDTAQLRNGAWITAVPTPGSAPGAATVEVDAEDSQTDPDPVQTTSGNSSSRTESVQLVLPDISLQLDMDVPQTVHVGQPFELSVEPSGVGNTIANSLVYQWSLGNGDWLSGKEVSYTFHHPGEYVVVVSGEYKRQKQFARQTVQVLPVELQLSKTSGSQSYVLKNLSNTEIDIGGYRLVGTSEHVFPKHTIILPQSKIIIPLQITDYHQAVAALYDETGGVVALHMPGYVSVSEPVFLGTEVSRTIATPVVRQSAQTTSANFGFVSDVQTSLVDSAPTYESPTLVPTAQAAEVGAQTQNNFSHDWPIYGLIALLILGTIGIYLVPQKKDDPPWV